MKKLVLALCCFPLVTSLPVAAEIYKWKDKSGKIQYSDSPPLSNIPYTTLSGKKPAQPAAPAQAPAPDAAATPAPGGKAGETPPGKPTMPPGGPQAPTDPNASKDKVPQELKDKAAQDASGKQAEEKKVADADAKAKEQACKAARSRLAQFEQGGRIYRVNERGEREYYGDKEIAAEIQNAKDDVAANCQ